MLLQLLPKEVYLCFFFFQAEDGIRDATVTGVQTCALPILPARYNIAVMTCAEFLDRYTDFRDGLITAPREVRRFQRHLAWCPACRRYDTTVRRSVLALRAVETIEPSPDFRRRLDARLAQERRALVAVPASAGIAAALFVAAALAMVALEGVRRPEVARAPVLPPAPFPKPVAHARVPFVSLPDPRARVATGTQRPYGSALVEPASAGR